MGEQNNKTILTQFVLLVASWRKLYILNEILIEQENIVKALGLLVPPDRIELSTSSLPMMCSTTEPWRQKRI